MKRAGYLLESAADMDNLRLAYRKAQRGKSGKAEVLAFAQDLDKHLLSLREQILSEQVSVGNYRYFKVYDPKERQICAAAFSERVLHHALMNVCHPHFERIQIYDSYASRIGKGTYKGIERAQQMIKRYEWYLKLDFRKYFDSISHSILKSQLARLFKDQRLLRILYQIIDTYQTAPGRGVPIGNLTSQYFANHYLAVADHYAKEVLHVPAYTRYMDDMVLWHNDKAELLEIGKRFDDFTTSTLRLELKPVCLNGSSKGLPFLGYLVFPGRIHLAQRSRSRFTQKLKKYQSLYDQQQWDDKTFQNHLMPLLAFTEKADAVAFRRQVLRAVSAGYQSGVAGRLVEQHA
ncbi:MAG: reverse transcriptase domain-containing protein [Spirosomataceae bacterium]